MVSFELLNDAAGYQFKLRLRSREIDKTARINQRRTANAHVHFLGSATEKIAHIVAQLGTSHDGVVAENHTFTVDEVGIGNEFHLGHQLAQLLCGRGKTTGPGRGILHDTPLVRNVFPLGIS